MKAKTPHRGPTTMPVLIVDDETPARNRLAESLASRGFRPILAASVADAEAVIVTEAPAFAVIDPYVVEIEGFGLVRAIRQRRSDARITILTGHASLAAAVTAVKLGTGDFLPKPTDPELVAETLLGDARGLATVPSGPLMTDKEV